MSMNTFPLDDKVVLITGGLGGISMGVAQLVVKREGKVFLADVKEAAAGLEEARQKLPGADVGYVKCDVTKREEFEACFEKCKEKFGPIDVFINCAGVAGEKNWEKLYNINIKGTHLGVELAFKHMGKNSDGGKGGVVVNLSSTAGLTCIGDMYATPAYTASKHAVSAMTRTFGHEFHFNRTGVKVMALAPYWVDTPLVVNGFEAWTDDTEARAAMNEAMVGKDMLKVDDVALKLINILNSKSGSVWMIRPEQAQPFNIPDYRLPKKQGYATSNTFLKPYGLY